MSNDFNAQEIFDIAIRIEENGHTFYNEAINRIDSPALVSELAQLAAWEDGHIAIMKKMKKELGAHEPAPLGFYNPEEDAALYIKSIADSHIFIENGDTVQLLDTCQTPADILKLALQFEKDSVTYYASLKEGIQNKESKAAVNKILHEELAHVAHIQKIIDSLL